MLSDFETHDLDLAGTRIHARSAGRGSPVLLLHGYPQTHVMWHRVAPALAERHTVVVADLRGYGDSCKPATGYDKRTMAADQVALMAALGHDQFAVVGHDRGARVAHRMCRDHPGRITRAAVLDIVPTRYALEHVDRALAQAYEHWFFLSQATDVPERLIGADPEFYLRTKLRQWAHDPDAFDPAAVEEYVRCFSHPDAVHASCEDYRAAVGPDLEHDADGSRVECPLLVLWGAEGFVGRQYDVLSVWRDEVARPELVSGEALPCGHFLPEEAPTAVQEALTRHLG